MKTDIEREFEADSERVTAIANEQLRLGATAAQASIAKREAVEKAEREEKEKAAREEAEAKRSGRRAKVLQNAADPDTAPVKS